MAHKLAGPQVARTLIIAAAVIYLIVQAFFAIIAGLPPEMTPEESAALGQMLTPEWRFLLAAVVASVLSQLVDTEVYTRWVNRFGGAHQWGRVLVSNLIGIPLDRILFLLIAFLGAWSGDEFVAAFIGTSIVRLVFGFLSIPGIYLVEEHSEDWVHITEIRHTDPPSLRAPEGRVSCLPVGCAVLAPFAIVCGRNRSGTLWQAHNSVKEQPKKWLTSKRLQIRQGQSMRKSQ